MVILDREIEKFILDYLIPNKVIVITGARRVGKTYLIKSILQKVTEPYILLNGENITTLEQLERRSVENYKTLLHGCKLLVIDEAQKIPEIGLKLKLMIDEIEGLKIIVTGSSAFDIYNVLGEPLTGRKYSFSLYPFSEKEYSQKENLFQIQETMRQRIVFGNYPELLQMETSDRKINYLKELISSYLLKDILVLETIKNSSVLLSLLRLLAFQIGNEVSINEIGTQLSVSKNTVAKYIDLLEKVFIIFHLDAFSRNKRKEISKSKKYYFWDNGIRNAVISNFNSIELRDDIGRLWENYIISERLKHKEYSGIFSSHYFWRTYDRQEIDYIEEENEKITAYEIKWKDQNLKIPSFWKTSYPNSNFHQITSSNYLSFLGLP